MYFKGSKCRPYDEQIEVIFRNDSELHKYKPDVFVMCDNPEKQDESIICIGYAVSTLTKY